MTAKTPQLVDIDAIVADCSTDVERAARLLEAAERAVVHARVSQATSSEWSHLGTDPAIAVGHAREAAALFDAWASAEAIIAASLSWTDPTAIARREAELERRRLTLLEPIPVDPVEVDPVDAGPDAA